MIIANFKKHRVTRTVCLILLVLFPAELLIAETPLRIMPNDILKVQVIADTTMSGLYKVTSDGTLPLPLIQEVRVENLTLSEANNLLNSEYSKFINNPRVNISIEEYTGHLVYILGAVMEPGAYPFPGRATLLEVLPLAKGYTVDADISKVTILRSSHGQHTIYTVNLKKLLNGSKKEKNIEIKAGDVVEIPFKASAHMENWSKALSVIISAASLAISLYNLSTR